MAMTTQQVGVGEQRLRAKMGSDWNLFKILIFQIFDSSTREVEDIQWGRTEIVHLPDLMKNVTKDEKKFKKKTKGEMLKPEWWVKEGRGEREEIEEERKDEK